MKGTFVHGLMRRVDEDFDVFGERARHITYTYAAGAQGDGRIGSFVESELAIQAIQGDGWSSGWQADGMEECMNDGRLSEGGGHLHPTRATRTRGDVLLEDTGQKLGPGNTMSAMPGGAVVLTTFTSMSL